jgi:hypothetical protein
MSYLMDYGDDWPPAPQPPAQARPERIDWRQLAQRCINAIALFSAIAGIGLALLVVHDAMIQRSSVPSTPQPAYTITTVTP